MSKKHRKQNRYRDNSDEIYNGTAISESDMKILAEHIENYLDVFQDIFIIPDSLKQSEKTLDEAMKVTTKLIHKLRNSDRSVFKPDDDWNSI